MRRDRSRTATYRGAPRAARIAVAVVLTLWSVGCVRWLVRTATTASDDTADLAAPWFFSALATVVIVAAAVRSWWWVRESRAGRFDLPPVEPAEPRRHASFDDEREEPPPVRW
ncbi:MAG: hypothetical protein NVV70_05130 [Cellulomonas sp.]|uniref:Lipoprotein n=1 Tax=Cellulomonas gelida TaxID=1712 RepID=A0A4Y3KJS1_9CELL|nr:MULTISPECIES: hypothetical protein [Cellulomonas]KMM45313.1 hypothetical protein CWIS_11195 [Cellulomonas sp. A375-1]MCR6647539.1 hypothetical protein [Cellulomonas sp.]MCR6703529.1 hypothetical protein [Cellulomonas sp.]GEA84252.1 hypothetical protein CGE01nite_15030 [Cellulomonas gelida]GGL36732.1 hypothetical protein GCM10009774_29100 [Cellulomonas gelida]